MDYRGGHVESDGGFEIVVGVVVTVALAYVVLSVRRVVTGQQFKAADVERIAFKVVMIAVSGVLLVAACLLPSYLAAGVVSLIASVLYQVPVRPNLLPLFAWLWAGGFVGAAVILWRWLRKP